MFVTKFLLVDFECTLYNSVDSSANHCGPLWNVSGKKFFDTNSLWDENKGFTNYS